MWVGAGPSIFILDGETLNREVRQNHCYYTQLCLILFFVTPAGVITMVANEGLEKAETIKPVPPRPTA